MNDRPTIEFASQDIVDEFEDEIREIELALDEVLDIRGAWISDESCMMDFYSMDKSQYMHNHRRMCEALELEFIPSTYVVDVARMLYEKKNQRIH